MSKVKIVIFIFAMLLTANVAIFYINKINIEDRIKLVLDDTLIKLDVHYKLALDHQRQIADTFYTMTNNQKGLLTLYSKVFSSSKEEKKKLRNELKILLDEQYKMMKNVGIVQFQFFLPDNKSFLRMDKMNQFGDNITNHRPDVVFTNKTKEISRGLVKGSFTHAFRNVYPLFDNEGKHLGAVEISFSSDLLQDDLTSRKGVHAHFLIEKKLYKKSNMNHHYKQSSEHEDYLVNLTESHSKEICIIGNEKKLKNIQEDIKTQINKGKEFSIYVRTYDLDIEVISFLPIKNFDGEDIAWLVSYTKNKFIHEVLKTGQLINVFSFLVIALFAFFIYLQIMAERRIKREHTLLDDVINSSEDMIFVTNFKKITFLNKKFKAFMSITSSRDIDDVTSYFVVMHSYLHKGLLVNDESFNELINRTPEEDRIVCLLDAKMSPKAFVISTVESSYTKGDYLVTLTDITKIKERELIISNKAFYDGLTGVYNRNKFDELIDSELKRDRRYNTKLSIAIVDIDYFKNFNDTYGHLIGDEVLIMIAQYLDKNVRITDVFARWGGEEFVILFPDTTDINAKGICEKLRIAISKLNHSVAGHVTASFGVTQYQKGDDAESLFKRCDDALYLAKEEGRNRVCIK